MLVCYYINCSKAWGFPFYGKDYQGHCDCNYWLCDHKLGCTKNNGMFWNNFSRQLFKGIWHIDLQSFQFLADTMKSLSQTSAGASVSIINITTKLVKRKFPKDSSFFHALQSPIFYINVAFVACFGLFLLKYFYKNCIKKPSSINGKTKYQVSNQRELYKMLHQLIHIRREINILNQSLVYTMRRLTITRSRMTNNIYPAFHYRK